MRPTEFEIGDHITRGSVPLRSLVHLLTHGHWPNWVIRAKTWDKWSRDYEYLLRDERCQ